MLRAARLTDGGGELPADLGDDRGQVPLADRGQVIRVGTTLGAVAVPPLVLLVIAPGPVGPDRLEHPAGLGRRLSDLGGQENHTLGVVARPVARLGKHPRGDRPGRLGPGLLGNRRLLDTGQCRQGRLRLSLVKRRLNLLPGLSPRALGNVDLLEWIPTEPAHLAHGEASETNAECRDRHSNHSPARNPTAAPVTKTHQSCSAAKETPSRNRPVRREVYAAMPI